MSETPRIIVAALGFIVMMSGIVVGNRSLHGMLDRVNQDVRPEWQIPHVWWGPGKAQEVRGLYRQMEPEGKLLPRYKTGIALLATGFAAIAFSFFALANQ
jgi:hypothetical protein